MIITSCDGRILKMGNCNSIALRYIYNVKVGATFYFSKYKTNLLRYFIFISSCKMKDNIERITNDRTDT